MPAVTERFRCSDDLTCAALCNKYYAHQERHLENSTRKPSEKIPLYISSYYEGPGGGWDGSGCVPAIEMAFDDINARPDILSQYELRPIWNDTKCEAGSGSRALFDQLFREPSKIMILGGGCSPPAEAIASTAHYWNLITAYKEGITGKGYVWMMLGWYEHKFWEKSRHADDIIDCTAEEMDQAVDGYIGITQTVLNDPAIITVANITSREYVSRLKLRLTQPENLKYDFNPYGSTGYDGAWSIALMLHEAALVLEGRNATRRLEDFTYNESEMRDLFFKLLADVQFEGVSMVVENFINGDRIGVIQLEQLQSKIWHIMATITRTRRKENKEEEEDEDEGENDEEYDEDE
ncbi:gamma-aminobutyric acid type B receptor subunit 1-like [Amphiura filiformis]|uniref:gamma-aminobutyric acid type B receptor subunit 1-like n=1 Tax=Amphiura filiformis TaxID=82378 RepID=UPI003B227442